MNANYTTTNQMLINITRDDKPYKDFDFRDVNAESEIVVGYNGDNNCVAEFDPPVEDGTKVYSFKSEDQKFSCKINNRYFYIDGTVEVASSNNLDSLRYKLSGTFKDGVRVLKLVGTAQWDYSL